MFLEVGVVRMCVGRRRRRGSKQDVEIRWSFVSRGTKIRRRSGDLW